jgi:NTP pyrophosphatase (non-canonical NTP hydrolase)
MNRKLLFEEIVNMQHEFDVRHGFIIDRKDQKSKYNQISKDLIGMFGEIGEFSNIIKKIQLSIDYKKGIDGDLAIREECLRQELVDTFIYLIRIAKSLDFNLEDEYLTKLKKNEDKYARYE